ncbi:sigma-70 family RNA polymerase sigma factor, partial [candidate division KSB3 bacterium]|nr:sigma-70 family RNA polymerase sigma factor [candidate division KSB3 bacterium]
MNAGIGVVKATGSIATTQDSEGERVQSRESSPMTDSEILSQIKAGDPDAFRALIEGHQHTVVNICYRFLNNREDAEDVAQEVFLEVYRSLETFRGEAKVSTWIYRIAVSKSLDLLRRRKRQKRVGRVRQFLGIAEESRHVPASLEPNPAQEFEQQERARILRQAVDALPANQHIAFT